MVVPVPERGLDRRRVMWIKVLLFVLASKVARSFETDSCAAYVNRSMDGTIGMRCTTSKSRNLIRRDRRHQTALSCFRCPSDQFIISLGVILPRTVKKQMLSEATSTNLSTKLEYPARPLCESGRR